MVLPVHTWPGPHTSSSLLLLWPAAGHSGGKRAVKPNRFILAQLLEKMAGRCALSAPEVCYKPRSISPTSPANQLIANHCGQRTIFGWCSISVGWKAKFFFRA